MTAPSQDAFVVAAVVHRLALLLPVEDFSIAVDWIDECFRADETGNPVLLDLVLARNDYASFIHLLGEIAGQASDIERSDSYWLLASRLRFALARHPDKAERVVWTLFTLSRAGEAMPRRWERAALLFDDQFVHARDGFCDRATVVREMCEFFAAECRDSQVGERD